MPALTFGQDFTLEELIKLHDMRIDHFDTYLEHKGYSFESAEETNINERKGVLNNYVKRRYNGTIIASITKIEPGNYVNYNFYSRRIYSKIKKEIQNAGFEYIGPISFIKGESSIIYGKGELAVYLSMLNFNNRIDYSVSVRPKANFK